MDAVPADRGASIDGTHVPVHRQGAAKKSLSAIFVPPPPALRCFVPIPRDDLDFLDTSIIAIGHLLPLYNIHIDF